MAIFKLLIYSSNDYPPDFNNLDMPFSYRDIGIQTQWWQSHDHPYDVTHHQFRHCHGFRPVFPEGFWAPGFAAWWSPTTRTGGVGSSHGGRAKRH